MIFVRFCPNVVYLDFLVETIALVCVVTVATVQYGQYEFPALRDGLPISAWFGSDLMVDIKIFCLLP